MNGDQNGFEPNANGFGQNPADSGQNQQSQNNFGTNGTEQNHTQNQNGAEQNPNRFGQNSNGFGQNPNGFGQNPNGFGQNPNGFGQNPYTQNQGGTYGFQNNPYAPSTPNDTAEQNRIAKLNADANSAQTMSIIGLIVGFICCSLAGIVLGILALSKSKSVTQQLGYEPAAAKTARIVGIIAIVASVAGIVLQILFSALIGSEMEGLFMLFPLR
ncbi:MAG: hypothetical protein SOT42_03900 [Eubacteriales bacterium]|nr:hypothetical protein [Eubacteriales bacterium]